jgi:hypothetical protein
MNKIDFTNISEVKLIYLEKTVKLTTQSQIKKTT